MKKFVMSFVAVAVMLFVASCGNKSSNANAEAETQAEAQAETETETEAEAVDPTEPTEVAYESFNWEKAGVTVDVLKGMKLISDPETDTYISWTIVPENDQDAPMAAFMSLNVFESSTEYDDQTIQENFDMITGEAEKNIDLQKKEITYSYAGSGEQPTEFRRIIFKGNKQATIGVGYTERWSKRLSEGVRNHILNSAKFN